MTRDPELKLQTERLTLCLPPLSAAPRVLAYFDANRAFHAPWDPPHPKGFDTEAYWEARLTANRSEYAEDRSLRLFLFHRDREDGEVLGTANFSGIVRGAFQACRLGYALGQVSEGKGLMYEALREALRYVFDDLALHRVEANYISKNKRSGRLLKRLGFRIEGRARAYLFIDGAWRDHVLTSKTSPH